MRMGKRRAKKRFFIIILAVVLLTMSGFFLSNKVHGTVTLEAGEKVLDISQFIKKEGINATFVTDPASIDMGTPGSYEIKIKIENRVYTSKLNIVDTIPPTAEAVNQKIPLGETIKAEAFLANIVDATKVMVSFLGEPDFSLVGLRIFD